MQLKMSFTMEKVLADARMLANRLKEHDSAADSLIAVTQTMYRRVDSMRQYQEDLNELNEIARHRPRSNLILGLMQENTQIRELQQENKELRACLEEHQSALELIMSKYREQMCKLVMANKLDRQSKDQIDGSQEVGNKLEKICEMAAIMQKAIRIDETEAMRDREHISQLETENKTLRELLLISFSSSQEVSRMDRGIQANMGPLASLDSSGQQDTESQGGTSVTTDDEDHHFLANDMNASVIENKSFPFGAPDKASSPVGTWAGREMTGSVSSDTSSVSHNDSADEISLKDVAVSIKILSDGEGDNGESQSKNLDQGSATVTTTRMSVADDNDIISEDQKNTSSSDNVVVDSEASKNVIICNDATTTSEGHENPTNSGDCVESDSNSLTLVNDVQNCENSSSSC